MQRIIRFPKTGEAVIERLALEAFPAFTPVILDDDGFIAASNLNLSHAGRRVAVALTAGIPGNRVSAGLQGVISNVIWSWSDSGAIFLGDKTLVQMPPATGFLLILGLPKAANSFYLDPEIPFLRSNA